MAFNLFREGKTLRVVLDDTAQALACRHYFQSNLSILTLKVSVLHEIGHPFMYNKPKKLSGIGIQAGEKSVFVLPRVEKPVQLLDDPVESMEMLTDDFHQMLGMDDMSGK